MFDDHTPDPITTLTRRIARSVGRTYFGAATLIGLGSLALHLLLPDELYLGGRAAVGLALLLFSLVAAVAFWRSADPEFRLELPMLVVAVGAIALAGGTTLMFGDGLRSPVLALVPPVVCVVVGLAPVRHAVAVVVFAAFGVGGLAFAEATGIVAAPSAALPLGLVVWYHLLAIGCAAIAGGLFAQMQAQTLQVAGERERRFRSLLAMAADGYWELDADGRYERIAEDPAAGERADDKPSALGRTPWELSRTGGDDSQIDALRADFELRQPFSGVLIETTDARGRARHQRLSGRPRFDAKGAFAGYWGIVRDVTDEVETERARAASESRYRELFDRSPSPLVLHRRGAILDANDAAARLLDLPSAAACVGLDLLAMYAEGESRDRALADARRLELTPAGSDLPVSDFQLVSAAGRRLTVQASGVRVQTDAGAATLSIFFDITARVGAESALRRSEALLTMLFATSPDCITLTELATGRYLLVNQMFSQLTGYRTEEVIGRTASELRIWANPADREKLVGLVAADGRADGVPMTFRTKRGALVSMLVSAARFEFGGREHLVINARDTTESDRVRNENAAMLRNASIGIAFTRDGRFVRVNPYFERLLGWPEGSMAGLSGTVVWPDAQAYAEVGAEVGPALLAGRAVEIERTVRRRDGSTFVARVLAQALDPLDPARGGTIWIGEDVTERRQVAAALATARDAAEAASKAKSAFLANMSHEIRTPLNGMLGLARLARSPELAPARRDQYLAQITDSAQSLASIISDILDLAKIEAGKIQLESVPFDLRDNIVSVHHGYQAIAEAKGIDFTLALDEALPAFVLGDPVRLRQIILNFLGNALKFTARGSVAIEAGMQPSGRVRIAVRDTGPGIDSATQARLFEPFTQADDSTTRRFGGTGLGLSICRELALLMGGSVGLTSEPGRGSIFWTDLPLQEVPPPAVWRDTSGLDPELLNGARVLLVEDNPVNMTVASAMLEQWGVDVLQATDGRAAIDAALRAHAQGRPVDLVLMDVQMPGMSGHEAARELRRHWGRNELPIVALTAAALVSERDQALEAGMNAFLTKPIDGSRLRDALMRQLSGKSEDPVELVSAGPP